MTCVEKVTEIHDEREKGNEIRTIVNKLFMLQ